jgi:NADH-quinone oxidoreductase subunit G
MVTVTVCVGSSCHIKGAREVIMRFNELLKELALEDKVELKGSFCMERCGEGINWQINDEPLTSPTVEDALETFRAKIVEPIDTLEI